MTLFWDTTAGAVERYRLALGADITHVESSSAAGRAIQEDPRLAVVVLGPGVDFEHGCDLAEWLRIDRPEVGVIMTRQRLDVTVLSQALRSGIRDVVAADDLTALSEAVVRSRDLSARMNSHSDTPAAANGKVVTIFSAKGGVGKTTLATNVGAELAHNGVRTLLIDLDLSFGDVAISLQQLPQRSIGDVVAMSGHLDERGLASVMTSHASGLDVLAAPSEPAEADRIPPATINEVVKVARRMYDIVVVDTPPSFTEHVLAACDISDLIVLIATLDIPAVKNLRLTLETLDLLGNARESRIIVLNKSDAKVGLRASDVVNAVKQDIAVMVPNSLSVPASINRGVPIILDEPKHAVSNAIRDLSEHWIRERLFPQTAEAGPAGRKSFWSKR